MATYNNHGSTSNQANTQNFHGNVYFNTESSSNRNHGSRVVKDGSGLSSSQKPCWVVPLPKNRKFVGRKSQLTQLETMLRDGTNVAITGLGGIGKTQIALQFAYRAREKYPECSVFWVPAVSLESVKQAYLQIASQLGIAGSNVKEGDVMNIVKDYLSKESSGQWILIFDNADDLDMWFGDESSQSLIQYLPRNSKSLTIFTTRSWKAASKLAPGNIISVQEMDLNASKMVLENAMIDQEILHQDRQSEMALLEYLIFLPLAIVQAAAYINSNQISPAQYLSLLREQGGNEIELLSEDFEDEGRYRTTKNPIATTWLISFEKILATDPLAAHYLSFMACLEPKAIPKSLLPPASSSKVAIEALGTLKAYSFVTEREADESFDMHRLVSLATRNWLRRSGSLEDQTIQTIKVFRKAFPSGHHENRLIWRAYLPHARHLMGSQYFDWDDKENITLIQKFASCLLKDGILKEAEELLEEAFETHIRLLGLEDPKTLLTMAELSNAYAEQGKLNEAKSLLEQNCEASERLLGPEHPDTLVSMNNLALIYADLRELEAAESLLLRVLEIRKRLMGPEHPRTLYAMDNLAGIYADMGLLDKAEPLRRRALDANIRLLGEEHPDTLISMGNMARLYLEKGQFNKAKHLQSKTLETEKRVLGPEHFSTLNTMGALAETYQLLGQLERSEQMQSHVLETSQRVLGRDHPITLRSMRDLAVVLKEMGQLEQAIPLLQTYCKAKEKIWGPKHTDTMYIQKMLKDWQSGGKTEPSKRHKFRRWIRDSIGM